jgi:hypothetical protein
LGPIERDHPDLDFPVVEKAYLPLKNEIFLWQFSGIAYHQGWRWENIMGQVMSYVEHPDI